MAQVKIKNVVKIYPGNIKAVDNVTLDVNDKEFIVLVGPSGCGKSTTLRMVAGLEQITEGTIAIGDRIVNDVAPKDRDIAMVFQNYALYPHMTVYKNMAFGLKLRKVPKPEIEQRVNDAATILGIKHLLQRKPKALSGGQRQRVAVGRAIVRKPKCFLFDEPLSNLDAKLRIETRAELKRLHQKLQTTTIYVTHDQEEAMTLGDRVVVMNDGIVHQCDSPMNVYQNPANRFVAGFLGTPPMNFFDGELVQNDNGICFQGQGIDVKLTNEQAAKLSSRVGQAVTLGVRPENLRLKPNNDNNCQTINTCINVIEPLGATMDLYASTTTDATMIARVEAALSVKPNDSLALNIEMHKVHLFAPGTTGENLTL